MLALVITATNIKDLAEYIKKSEEADLIELRLDYFKGLSNEKLKAIFKICRKKCNKPIILTARKKSEGGFFDGYENERIELLKNAIEAGAGFVDIEFSSSKNSIKSIINNKKNAKVIVSYHNFKETPDNLTESYNKIKNLNPDLIKIATTANSVIDNFKIFDLIKIANKENRKITAFCMGSYGQFSRILSIILGSEITYASLNKGSESASGQYTLRELIDEYNIKKLNKNTRLTGLIGNPVEHSWSHIMHNAAFDKIGVNAVYLKFKVDRLKEFINYFKKLNILGFSVTIPYKVEIMKYLDSIDKKAKAIGAVNTIAVKNKKLIGHNTDCDGAMQPLKEKTELGNKNAVILGAGGSARAIAYGLIENNSNVTILNRTIGNAKSIANGFDCNYGSLMDLKNIDYDILINTTPIGMYPNSDKSPIHPNLIKKGSIVFDIVFNPFKTKLLKEAEKKGCITIPGFEMLVHGNALQFKLWTGKDAPKGLIRKKVIEYVKNLKK